MKLMTALNAHLIKPLWYKYKGQDYFRFLPGLRRFHRQNIKEIKAYQLSKLRRIINKAYERVPFYRREWREVGFEPGQLKSLADMRRIPILTKQKLRTYHDDFSAEDSDGSSLIVSGTGGTTDSPIQIKYSRERQLFKVAEMHFFQEWWGWHLGDKVAYLWGVPQDVPNIHSLKWRVANALIG